jgi:hypothetical protein
LHVGKHLLDVDDRRAAQLEPRTHSG